MITNHAHHDADLMSLQLQLEEEMRSLGIERYRRNLEQSQAAGNESRVPAVRRLMSAAHQRVVEGIEAFIEECKAGKATRNGIAFKIMSSVDVDLQAHLALRSVLDSISTRETLNNAALQVGGMIEDELHYRAYKEQDERGFKKALTKAKKSPSAAYKRRHMRETARIRGVEFNEWPKQDRLRVGLKLIEIIQHTTGLVETQRVTYGEANSPILLVATQETMQWLEGANNAMETMAPTFLPTIIPPKPWTDLSTGGYHSGRVRRLPLVKSRGRNCDASQEVLAAVNAVQNTPWRINSKVLGVMDDLYSRGITMNVVPSPDRIDLPNRPVWLTEGMQKEDMTEEQLAEFLMWKRMAAQVYEENARLTCRRITFMRKLWVAKRFAEYPAIYFPHTLDFRGRMYPVPLYLHPQGDDTCRGLLEFAEGKLIGNDEAVLWLAAHGAGLWGVDKVSFEERLAWVKQHEKDFLECAADPLSNVFWATAEKPWSALAFCFEWAGYVREGLSYVSHLPVQMDGSCNGLQHFSAMLRDPVGGKAVNLVPGPKPSDIYSEVGNVVAKLIEQDALSDDEDLAKTAAGWLGNVTRKVVKRPVMTLAYGAKRYGFSEMVFNDTVSPWKMNTPDAFPWKGNGWDAAQYMGGRIWDAVGSVVVAARAAMEWLQECARVCSKAQMPIVWKTPDGFIAYQEYTLPNMKRLELTFGKERIVLSVDADLKEKLDSRKQANGIAPNFVHSLDAAHLRRTVNSCGRAGIGAFSLIHDSYGTHACNAPLMARILREEFFLMYVDHDVLASFAEDLRCYLPEGTELPPLPEKGELNLSDVLESPFFFA